MRLTVLLVACVSIGCGSSDEASPAATSAPDGAADAPIEAAPIEAAPIEAAPEGTVDAGPPRSFLLASTGARLDLADGFVLTRADLATDVDVISVHQDFFGVPWDELAAGADPPAPWVAVMDAIADDVRAMGKPVFLSLAVLSGTRDAPAEQAVVQGGKLTKIAKGTRCQVFDSVMRQAYAKYATWMVAKLAPRWVNVAVEMNGYMVCSDAAWGSLVDVSNAAYDAVKAASPGIVAFPSLQIDQLYGTDKSRCGDAGADACYDANYAKLVSLKRDRFGISTYPYLIDAIKTVPNLPADWLTRGADRGGERTIVAETGWISESVVAKLGDQCLTAITSDETAELAYLQRILADAESRRIELVTWWSNRDVVDARVMTDCPCTFDATWCALVDMFRSTGTDDLSRFYGEALLKVFGTMGVRRYEGAPKALVYPFWRSTLARPLLSASPD